MVFPTWRFSNGLYDQHTSDSELFCCSLHSVSMKAEPRDLNQDPLPPVVGNRQQQWIVVMLKIWWRLTVTHWWLICKLSWAGIIDYSLTGKLTGQTYRAKAFFNVAPEAKTSVMEKLHLLPVLSLVVSLGVTEGSEPPRRHAQWGDTNTSLNV